MALYQIKQQADLLSLLEARMTKQEKAEFYSKFGERLDRIKTDQRVQAVRDREVYEKNLEASAKQQMGKDQKHAEENDANLSDINTRLHAIQEYFNKTADVTSTLDTRHELARQELEKCNSLNDLYRYFGIDPESRAPYTDEFKSYMEQAAK